MPPGCAFAPRCAERIASCDAAIPADAPVGLGHRAACLRALAPQAAEAVPA
jgi:ABC-type dipeptide/oligopeptide/nickel transport system ATPase component